MSGGFLPVRLGSSPRILVVLSVWLILIRRSASRYEAANMVISGGLPDVQVAEVKANKINEKATDMAGSAGAAVGGVAQV